MKLEGDAVFAAAPAARLDGQGDRVLEKLKAMYGSFIDGRTRAIPARDHVCTACPAVAHLDLKMVLHRGNAVRQAVGSGSDLLGPAVTVAHRLLKNNVRERFGARPYLLVTGAASTALGIPQVGASITRRTQMRVASRGAYWHSTSSGTRALHSPDPESRPTAIARLSGTKVPGGRPG